MRQNPGAQANAFEAVIEASHAVDAKHGTKVAEFFLNNVKESVTVK
jgi:hypothetical protein